MKSYYLALLIIAIIADMAKNCRDCKGYPLKEIPHEVYNIIIDKQAKEKKRRSANKSLDRVIYTIIREWREFSTSEPIVVINSNDEFMVMREVSDNERLHILNAVNKRVKN